jgi:hypothetical protein
MKIGHARILAGVLFVLLPWLCLFSSSLADAGGKTATRKLFTNADFFFY